MDRRFMVGSVERSPWTVAAGRSALGSPIEAGDPPAIVREAHAALQR
jgi:hypothetical protein